MPLKIKSGPFKQRLASELNNDFMRKAVSSAQDGLGARRDLATEQIGEWEKWREAGQEIRQHTVNNLAHYLEQFSEQVTKSGGHVFFAKDDVEATNYIKQIAQQKNAKKIVKSKSMVTEEIGLNAALESIGCEVVETDLGEYILQIDDHDPPSHIVVPALHKKKEQIRDVFVEKLNYTKSADPEELAKHARYTLREKFLEADLGITGCNFGAGKEASTLIPPMRRVAMGK